MKHFVHYLEPTPVNYCHTNNHQQIHQVAMRSVREVGCHQVQLTFVLDLGSAQLN